MIVAPTEEEVPTAEPVEEPDEEPTVEGPEEPEEPSSEEPLVAASLPAEPNEGGLPCLPLAAGLMLAPLLVIQTKGRGGRNSDS